MNTFKDIINGLFYSIVTFCVTWGWIISAAYLAIVRVPKNTGWLAFLLGISVIIQIALGIFNSYIAGHDMFDKVGKFHKKWDDIEDIKEMSDSSDE